MFTRCYSWWIEYKNPPVGAFAQVGNIRLHYLDIAAEAGADLPVLVFIHGASGNLNDQRAAFADALEGRARMIFVDRPGHGYSECTSVRCNSPDGQADVIAGLLDKLSIKEAIIIGHSFGGAVAAAFGVSHQDKTAGLVFIAPASHRWPGGVAWYYSVAAMPVVGVVFTELIVLPAGLLQLSSGIAGVFAPGKVPANNMCDSRVELVLRPREFRANARDVVALKENVTRLSKRYGEIKVPTEIITGDSDDIVLANIHSKGLERDIAGARLTVLENVGHKPDYQATQIVIRAIEDVARRYREKLK